MPVKVERRTVTVDGQVDEDVIVISETPAGKVVPKEIKVAINQAETLGQEIIDKAQ